jgi:hypothetical protein
MTTAVSAPADLDLVIRLETHVRASLEVAFAALLEQMSSAFDTLEGQPMPLKLEAFPGGRWFRDLGDGNGHCWGFVQSIKRPTLLEFSGPLMLSFAVINNVQYRLSPHPDGGTLIKFQHLASGSIPDQARQSMPLGWNHILAQAKARAESRR